MTRGGVTAWTELYPDAESALAALPLRVQALASTRRTLRARGGHSPPWGTRWVARLHHAGLPREGSPAGRSAPAGGRRWHGRDVPGRPVGGRRPALLGKVLAVDGARRNCPPPLLGDLPAGWGAERGRGLERRGAARRTAPHGAQRRLRHRRRRHGRTSTPWDGWRSGSAPERAPVARMYAESRARVQRVRLGRLRAMPAGRLPMGRPPSGLGSRRTAREEFVDVLAGCARARTCAGQQTHLEERADGRVGLADPPDGHVSGRAGVRDLLRRHQRRRRRGAQFLR